MEQKFKQLFKSDITWILLIAIITAIGGEVKLSPFSGENFRFGIGPITFLFMLLIRQPKNYILTGFMTAGILMFFRISIDLIIYGEEMSSAINEHLPSSVFYIVYSVGFYVFKLEQYKDRPVFLGLFATLIEISSNSIEHLLRLMLLPEIVYNGGAWLLLFAVAVLRSFFVVGLYSSITLAEQKKRLEEQLAMGSDLYIETLYLQKSMHHTEQIMADSYDLYRLLKKRNDQELAKKALYIAQEIHEVKKDAQRIFSGLSDLSLIQTDRELFTLSQILEMSASSNSKYAQHIARQVEIDWSTTVDFTVREYMLFMAILNNIVSNAVESIAETGRVTIEVQEQGAHIRVIISDNGKGISDDELTIIFEAGYTTKYSEKGVAATGIGLSHVKEAVKLLEGQLTVQSSIEGTTFIIDLPREKLEQGGTV
ncbi:sensor histidine kinase [Kurthia sibirica]|uniref:histidine kinase n=1 Tax=Kurthia sibirica TaxID=202750 RepID=A0A2U3AMC8_9BACL|nr:ATP-binding protein [Kurthia sibirica]PWI25679.1 histidine kinase [Kurthia sibirica]GEK33684.1 sensor histidine kinase [Kurthia sibirica]